IECSERASYIPEIRRKSRQSGKTDRLAAEILPDDVSCGIIARLLKGGRPRRFRRAASTNGGWNENLACAHCRGVCRWPHRVRRPGVAPKRWGFESADNPRSRRAGVAQREILVGSGYLRRAKMAGRLHARRALHKRIARPGRRPASADRNDSVV